MLTITVKNSTFHLSTFSDDAEECNEDISDNEEQNEMDDEANKIAADEAKKEGLVCILTFITITLSSCLN